MKKLVLLIFTIALFHTLYAQTDSAAVRSAASAATRNDSTRARRAVTSNKKDWSKVSLANRANDHFMVQLGYNGWAGKSDTMKTKGLSRTVNVYFMLDFPFKTDPRFSIGLGAGISSSSMYFENTSIGIAGTTSTLTFKDVSATNHFKKYKLATTYAEVPVELRFTADPEHNAKSWKIALGAKIGTMLNAHTKGKNLLSSTGSTVNAYTFKETSKHYFNGTRIAGTARIGYGFFSLFGTYQVNNLLNEGAGPVIHPYTVGLTISGL